MPNSATYTFLSKLLKQRKYLLEARLGNTSAQVRTAYEEVKKYAEYLNNETALKAWVKKNYDKVITLIPSNDASSKKINELNQLLQS